jgi:mannonate dehydratase
MKQSWRWFGPGDPIPLEHVKQAGATAVVSALHHLYRGEAWPEADVLRRRDEVLAAGLEWAVVESIPIHNSIKLRTRPYGKFIGAWKDSLRAIARAGVRVVCYNFMPVVDWTRTDLQWRLPSTGYGLRFDAVDFAAYDLFILRRKGAEGDHSEERARAAQARWQSMSEERRSSLERTIIAGLPGAEASYDREAIRNLIAEYAGLSHEDLRQHLAAFLGEVAPVAEELGIRLAIHPDDPPWPLFGLPRVVSTAGDVRAILGACPVAGNGLTFCVGSFGARADNDLPAMVGEFGSHIHFVHLRQVRREDGAAFGQGSFHESEHLEGSSDMLGMVRALLEEELRRRKTGRTDQEIPMRPDHGHLLGGDIGREMNPGYAYVGRLKGLAELRGLMHGLRHSCPQLPE